MRPARAALAVAAFAAAAGCDLMFPPGELAPRDGPPAPPDGGQPPDQCSPRQFDPRRYSEAWASADMMAWSTATALCAVRGWSIATIDDPSEATAIGTRYAGTDHWIGLFDVGGEVWRSVDGCPDPHAWDLDQPDSTTEDCAGLDGATFQLHSFPCGGSASSPDSMICEQPRPPTPACAADAARPYDVANYAVLSPATFDAARSLCTSMGMHLVVIDTPNESLAVATLSGGTDYWVGATDAAQEGVWQTETGCPGYLEWETNEPSNGGGTENCTSGIGAGRINDVDCTTAKLVICEGVPL